MVVKGTPDANHPFVGRLETTSGATTATLISDRHVLAAAHAVAQGGVFVLGADASQPETQFDIVATTVHPAYEASTYEHDLAVLQLHAEAAPGTAVAKIGESTPITAGTVGEIVGYGNTEFDGASQNTIRRAGGLTIDEVHPLQLVANQPEAAPAPGDSGAPVFVTYPEGPRLVGLALTGAPDKALFARVAADLSFIDDVVGDILQTMPIDRIVVPFIGHLTMDDTDPEWKLGDGSGPRVSDRFVPYSSADRMPATYDEVPPGPPITAAVSLVGLDAGSGQDTRVHVSVRNILTEGMEIAFATDGEARIRSVTVEWTAYFLLAPGDPSPG